VIPDFKEIMSHIPTCVSVIGIYDSMENRKPFGCTISSLISSSVAKDNEELLFVLKKDSEVGTRIKLNQEFSISVLSQNQQKISQFYANSANRIGSKSSFDQDIWVKDEKSPHLAEHLSYFKCKLEKTIVRDFSEVYFARVIEFSLNSETPALIYQNRSYGALKTPLD
jgi:flavin reductase (DIM6/NTAB) family NADH-FMN oxidoreductase RutF